MKTASFRTLLIASTTALILVGAFFVPTHAAHAQPAPTPPAQPTQEMVANPGGGDGAQSGWDMGSITIGIILSPVALISYAIFSVAKGLLWIAGILLNFSIVYLVFEFAKHLGTSPGMLLGWSVLRDLGNILLLFGFLTIGLQAILNVSHFSAGKTLSSLVLFAALLNFSLFVAGAVVDVSNGLTLALFSQNVGYKCEESIENCLNDGITGQIAQQANLLSAVGGGGQINDFGAQLASYADKPVESILQYLLLALFVSIAAAVIFAAGFLLITRGITLAFLLVTSPIGFAGMAVPRLHDMAGRWWTALINNALFAPVFLVLLFIGLRMTDGLATMMGGSGGIGGALLTGGTIDAGPIFFFILVMGFMIAALTVGKQFSIMGADLAIGAATRIASSPYLPVRDFLGERAYKAGAKYDQSGFARGLRRVGLGFVDDTIKSGFDRGKNVSVPGWGGYADKKESDKAREDELRHAQNEAHEKQEYEDAVVEARQRNNLAPLRRAANGMKLDALKATAQIKNGAPGLVELAQALTPAKFKEVVNDHYVGDGIKAQMKTARFGTMPTTVSQAAAGDAAKQKEVQQMSAEDIEMSDMLEDPVQRAELMRTISDSQYEALSKSGIDDNIKRDMESLRNGTGVGARFDTTVRPGGGSNAQDAITPMSPTKIAQLKPSILTNPGIVPLLRPRDLGAIARSDNLNGPQQAAMVAELAKIKARGPADPAYQAIENYAASLSAAGEKAFKTFFSW